MGTIVDKAAWQCGTQLQMMSERLSHRTNTFLPQESVTTALETLYYWFVASHATYLIVMPTTSRPIGKNPHQIVSYGTIKKIIAIY